MSLVFSQLVSHLQSRKAYRINIDKTAYDVDDVIKAILTVLQKTKVSITVKDAAKLANIDWDALSNRERQKVGLCIKRESLTTNAKFEIARKNTSAWVCLYVSKTQ